MDCAQFPEGRIDVTRDDTIITVTLIGWITESLTELVQNRVEAELLKADSSCILYDGLYMNDPSLTLVFLMQSFHQRLTERLAFLSRLAFGNDASKYRVFYNNRDEALLWLRE
jgi:hypothetical protein